MDGWTLIEIGVGAVLAGLQFLYPNSIFVGKGIIALGCSLILDGIRRVLKKTVQRIYFFTAVIVFFSIGLVWWVLSDIPHSAVIVEEKQVSPSTASPIAPTGPAVSPKPTQTPLLSKKITPTQLKVDPIPMRTSQSENRKDDTNVTVSSFSEPVSQGPETFAFVDRRRISSKEKRSGEIYVVIAITDVSIDKRSYPDSAVTEIVNRISRMPNVKVFFSRRTNGYSMLNKGIPTQFGNLFCAHKSSSMCYTEASLKSRVDGIVESLTDFVTFEKVQASPMGLQDELYLWRNFWIASGIDIEIAL